MASTPPLAWHPHPPPSPLFFSILLLLLLLLLLTSILLLIHHQQASVRRVRVPVVGPSGPISSWIGALLYARNARRLIAEGYEKHGDFAFQTSTMGRWEVFICNKEMIKEYWNLDADVMNANAVTADFFQAEYTLPGAAEDVHKIPLTILAKGLTWQRQRLITEPDSFADFNNEFLYAFNAEMGSFSDEWRSVTCFNLGTRVVSRLTAKALVGKPLCRDKELLRLFARYGAVVPVSGWFIAKWPKVLRPLVAKMCEAPKMAKRLDDIVSEMLAERRKNMPMRPNDLSDWMQSWADRNPHDPPYTDHEISLLITSLIFGAIHTTTQVLVHTLFEMATRPSYGAPLRAEITTALAANGGVMNKSVLESLTLVDSFVRECQRTNPLDAGSLARRVATDFTFKNGLFIPAGTFIFAPNTPVLADEACYPRAAEFDGFRHHDAKIRGEPQTKFTETSLKNLQFGGGRHSCPGRFMAADEIRLFVVHIVMNYEVCIRGKDGRPTTKRPRNFIFGKILFPDMGAEVMFRRRKTE